MTPEQPNIVTVVLQVFIGYMLFILALHFFFEWRDSRKFRKRELQRTKCHEVDDS